MGEDALRAASPALLGLPNPFDEAFLAVAKMTGHEWDFYFTCADCDEVFDSRVAPVFSSKGGDVLCFACARNLGAMYDAPRELWLPLPDIKD